MRTDHFRPVERPEFTPAPEMETLAVTPRQSGAGSNPEPAGPLRWRGLLAWSVVAVASFHLAYEFAVCAPLMAVFLLGLLQLARAACTKQVVYLGWALGLCVYGPQLFFFWSIFHQAAIVLWLILGSWLAVYLVLLCHALRRLGPVWGMLAAPWLWTGLEYFRSELYPLRFSWLNAGYLSPSLSGWVGMYGAGFALMWVGVCVSLAWTRHAWRPTAIVAVTLALMGFVSPAAWWQRPPAAVQLRVAGVQFEEQSGPYILTVLDGLWTRYPDAPLLVLSEYAFDGPVPPEVKAWCGRHRRWLIAGGKEYLDPARSVYRNTAFVVGPDGNEVFGQSKSQPIQFFDDGLPAARQAVWDSPWGKIGLCICYDLSYTRVTDRLIDLGAQMIIVPTMDVEAWGACEHTLHARVAPTRAAEYGVPIFRLCSSGISQAVSCEGWVLASAPFPGQGRMLAATMSLPARGGHVPPDRFLVWPCLLVVVVLLVWRVGRWLAGALSRYVSIPGVPSR